MNNSTSFFVVLGLLDAGRKSGYDIKRIIENEIGHYYKISNGQIYPALKSILGMSYASLSVEKTDGKPDRKVYLITEKGSAAFREWLKKPVDYHNPGGNELLLKLYFGPQASVDDSIRLITTFREIKAKSLNTYDDIHSSFGLSPQSSLPDHYSYLTLRYGQILAQANLQWCDEAIERIKELEGKQ